MNFDHYSLKIQIKNFGPKIEKKLGPCRFSNFSPKIFVLISWFL